VSSLRPLLTILLLAAVGVVLYMKINETEPVVPAGVGEWTAGPLEIGAGTAAGGAAASTSPPNYATDGAPAFNPGAVTPGASASTADIGGDAPSWSPGPAAVSDPPKPAATQPDATPDSSPIARTAEPQVELPTMPAMPGTKADVQTASPSETAPAGEAPTFTPGSAAPPAAVAETTPANLADGAMPSASSTQPPITPSSTQDASAASPSPSEDATKTAEATLTDSITPTDEAPDAATATQTPPPLFPAVRVAVQAELERG
jgi:hypothetical protein